MLEKLETLGSFTKFLIALVIYTGYLTWWAASVNSNILKNYEATERNRNNIANHIVTDYQNTLQTVQLLEVVSHMQKDEEQHEKLLTNLVEHQSKCSAVLETLLKRLERVEDVYHGGYKPGQWPSNNQ